MAKIELVNPIYQALEFGMVKNDTRTYIGFSGVGGACLRKQWMSFHWVYRDSYEQRIQRLFNRGKAEEDIIVADLTRAGMNVFNREAEIEGFDPHIKGHIDGEVDHVPGFKENTILLLEMKTMNNKNFKIFQDKGLKAFSNSYWLQIHIYMKERGLLNCLYVVTCKDDEARDYQAIPYDANAAKQADDNAMSVLMADNIPDRIGKSTYFVCKICPAKATCHGKAHPRRNCRTCDFHDIEEKGMWSCRMDVGTPFLSEHRQRTGCDEYKRMECLT